MSSDNAPVQYYGDEKQVAGAELAVPPSYDSSVPGPKHEGDNLYESTEEEINTLRHIGDKIPYAAWLVAVVELAERFTYYGLTGPWQNYMENKRDDPRLPGALGLGQSTATSLNYFFTFFCYVTPIFGAIVADSWLGRYNAILVFSFVYVVGLLILFCTSLPTSLEHGAGTAGLIVTMVILGFGTGGIKANVSPLIAEQYTETKCRTKVLKSGERVVVDPAITVQSLYNIFYWCINIGSLSAIATVWMELKIDFWAAFLLPFCFFFLGIIALFIGRNKYVVRPPKGSVIIEASKCIWMSIKGGFKLDVARPQFGDQFVDEMKRALVACRVFCFYPFFWLLYGQMNTNFVSMAGTMELHGLPNDLLFNLNPISIIIFIPIMERFVYPLFRKLGMPLKPITRITLGFLLCAGGMAYAAGIQKVIYDAGPCFKYPLECAASDDGNIPNKTHVALQVPAYVLIGLAEIFAAVTGLEYAFTKAPASMKSVVTSVYLLQNAFGAAIGIGVATRANHPDMVIFYSCLAGITAVAGGAFWFCFNHLNAAEEEMNALDLKAEVKPLPTDQVETAIGKIAHHGRKSHDGEHSEV